MYSIFQLPENFLHKKYTKDQANLWDSQMRDAATGSSETETVSEELTPEQKRKLITIGVQTFHHYVHTMKPLVMA